MPAENTLSTRTIVRTVLIVILAALALYVIYRIRKPLSFIVVAAFIAVAMTGPVNLLQRKMKRGLAIALAYMTLIAIPIVLGVLLIPTMVSQAEDLANNVPQYAADVTSFINDNETLNNLNEKYDFTSEIESAAKELPSKIGDAANILKDIGVGVVNSIFAFVTVLVLSIFMVASGPRWKDQFLKSQSADRAKRVDVAAQHVANAIGNYIGGAMLQAGIAAVCAFIVLEILGAPFAAPLALLVFFFDLIPVVGATIAAILIACRDAVRGLPAEPDRVGGLRDRLPADRELPRAAADPEAGDEDRAVRDAGRGALRLDAVRRARRDPRDPHGSDDSDHRSRVHPVPPRLARGGWRERRRPERRRRRRRAGPRARAGVDGGGGPRCRRGCYPRGRRPDRGRARSIARATTTGRCRRESSRRVRASRRPPSGRSRRRPGCGVSLASLWNRRSYRDRKGRSKLVRYYRMRPLGGEFEPNAEVDELRWLTPTDALGLLSHEHDMRLVSELA